MFLKKNNSKVDCSKNASYYVLTFSEQHAMLTEKIKRGIEKFNLRIEL